MVLNHRRERFHNSNAGIPTSDNSVSVEVTLHAVGGYNVIQKMKQVHEEIGYLQAT